MMLNPRQGSLRYNLYISWKFTRLNNPIDPSKDEDRKEGFPGTISKPVILLEWLLKTCNKSSFEFLTWTKVVKSFLNIIFIYI